MQTFGWRPTAFGSGVLLLLVGLPLAMTIKSRPEDHGETLDGLPPALLLCGTIDPLIDDSRLMAERWRNAQLILIPEGPHAFNHLPTAVARKTNAFVRSWLDERLATISMAAAAE